MKNNETKLISMITEEMKKSNVMDIIKNDREFEKRVKKITADVVTDLFRVLWQHNSIFKSLGD